MILTGRFMKDKTKYYIPSKLFEGNSFLKKIAHEVDGTINKELGEEIESLYDPNYIICIHRTQIDIDNSKDLIVDIFNNGLKDFGGNSMENTATPCNQFPVLISQLISAHAYRQNSCRGVIIVKVPKKDIGYSGGEALPIWIPTGERDFRNIESCNLLPEYVYGYLDCDVINGAKKGDIIKNPNYSDFHDYNTEGLLYDQGVADFNYKEKIQKGSR